jgi:hypothetical protein
MLGWPLFWLFYLYFNKAVVALIFSDEVYCYGNGVYRDDAQVYILPINMGCLIKTEMLDDDMQGLNCE